MAGKEILEEERMEASHKELASDIFENITDYLNGELAGSRAAVCSQRDGGDVDSGWRGDPYV